MCALPISRFYKPGVNLGIPDRQTRQTDSFIDQRTLTGGAALSLIAAYQLDYNEGWNAYWAQRAELGQPIYPPHDATLFNNYPPLSFLLVGALGRLGLDVWIAGRIVAWLSFAGCAVLIRAGCGRWTPPARRHPSARCCSVG